MSPWELLGASRSSWEFRTDMTSFDLEIPHHFDPFLSISDVSELHILFSVFFIISGCRIICGFSHKSKFGGMTPSLSKLFFERFLSISEVSEFFICCGQSILLLQLIK